MPFIRIRRNAYTGVRRSKERPRAEFAGSLALSAGLSFAEAQDQPSERPTTLGMTMHAPIPDRCSRRLSSHRHQMMDYALGTAPILKRYLNRLSITSYALEAVLAIHVDSDRTRYEEY